MKNQYSIERCELIDNTQNEKTANTPSTYNLDRTLKMMAEIHLVGDLVPHAWFSKIMLDCDPLYKVNFTPAPTKINAIKERTVYIYLDPISNDLVYTVELPENEDENETNYQPEKKIVTAIITREDLPEFYDSLFEKAIHGFNVKNLSGLEKDCWLTEKKAFFRITTQREHTRGKADLHGILLLSKIVYWYRPRLELDEQTGRTLGYRKKFKADKLQHSIGSFARKLGILYRQTSEALQRLEERGLITREYRLLKINGEKLPNRLFIGINPDAILAINRLDAKVLHDETMDESSTKKSLQYHGAKFAPPVNTMSNEHFNNKNEDENPAVEGYCETRSTMVRDLRHGTAQNAPPSCVNRMIYTNNTTKISTENTAAEAIGNFDASLNAQHIAAAAANYSQQNKTMHVAGQSLRPASTVRHIMLSVAEPIISDALTENQKSHLAERVSTLSLNDTDTTTLTEQIEAGLIDHKHLAKCGNDYQHKINAIFKMISEGTWTPPTSFVSAIDTQKIKAHREEQEALKTMMQQYNKHYGEYNHWKKMCDWLSEKSTAADLTAFNNFSASWRTSWENLCTVHKTICQTFPDAAIAAIPDAPETHKSTNNPLQTVGVIQ